MPHIKFDPTRELDFLSERMKRFAQEFPETFSFELGKGFEPRIDLTQSAAEVVLAAELPGMEKADVRLSIADGVLTLSGEKKAPEREHSTELKCERSFGAFSRKIELPADIDSGKISASMSNGVLEIRIPRLAAAHETTIDIEIQ